MGSRHHEARDSKSPKKSESGIAAGESGTRGRPAPSRTGENAAAEGEGTSDAGTSVDASPVDNTANSDAVEDSEVEANGVTSETRPSQPARAPGPEKAARAIPDVSTTGPTNEELEPHVAVTFGSNKASDRPPPSSGPISRPNIAGRYRLDRRLAEGGMGVVYAGWHITLDQPVAVKVIQKELVNNADAIHRFIEEARALAQLRGPHVAQVLDAGIEDGSPFIVMELLRGRDLRTLLEEQRQVSITQAVQLVRQACEAVAEAHAKGIMHRDLKPENLFLADSDDGTSTLKVIDFGISARQQVDGVYDSDQPGPGSPEYMAPEQLLRGSVVDHRADIWSLGIVLYELLAGVVPFEGETHTVCSGVVAGEPPSLVARRPEVPAALEALIMRCLNKSPAERFADAQEFGAALAPFAEVLPASPPVRTSLGPVAADAAPQLTAAMLRRVPFPNWRVAVGIILGCVVGVVVYFASRDSNQDNVAAAAGITTVKTHVAGDPQAGPASDEPIVAPVTDTPHVTPILGDDDTPPGPRANSGLPPGFRAQPSVAARRATTGVDERIDQELDDVGEQVAPLVDSTAPSEEEAVEARYALAASKPKTAASDDEKADKAPVAPAAPKAPSSVAFPDAYR